MVRRMDSIAYAMEDMMDHNSVRSVKKYIVSCFKIRKPVERSWYTDTDGEPHIQTSITNELERVEW